MSEKRTVLVPGGTGYIGSHTVVELLAAGRDVLVVDNLCNSKASVLDRIERIAGRRPEFAALDLLAARAGIEHEVVGPDVIGTKGRQRPQP